jgi:hypothetical protein
LSATISTKAEVGGTTSDMNGNLGRISLKSATFRQPSGIDVVAKACPDVERVRVVHSDIENTAFLDKSLRDLNMFRAALEGEESGSVNRMKVELEMNSINMLFLIQVRRDLTNICSSFSSAANSFQLDHISTYGRHLTKLVFTQCDFLHPQSLNKFARHCPNVESISLFG